MKLLRALKISSALVLCGSSMTAIAGENSAAAPEQGVWQKHEYSFQYFGFTTTYSCDGLASKLRVLLIAAGARAERHRGARCGAALRWRRRTHPSSRPAQ